MTVDPEQYNPAMPVVPRKPPGRPLLPLDAAILAQLDEPCRPVEIAARVDADTHTVAIRLRSLTERKLVERIRPPDAPRNGPGSALYRRLPD